MSFAKEQLLPGENLVVLARQHPLVLFRPVLLNVFVLVVVAGVSYYSGRTWFMVFLLFPLLYLLWEYLAWHRREYILTDRRVVRQEGVLSISSFDAPLDKINNVFHSQSFIGRILKYGEVGLETASEQGTTTFEFLSHPLDFKNAIVHQREMYSSGAVASGRFSQQGIPQLIEDLASLRDRNIITESEFQERKRALLEKM
jgi:uncharacterized membrane protein YdbT with pleckstrin-like domain